jgi:3-oxoacyl-(acyl-carrier-protein) synthase
MNYITRHARLQNGSIFLNGKPVWRSEKGFPDFLQGAYSYFGVDYPKFYKMDPMSQAGFLTADVLLKESKISEYESSTVGLVLSNAHASLDTDEKYFESSRKVASPGLFVYTLPNIVAGEICIRHKIKGENAFFISESFDGDLLFEYVEMVLAQGGTDACVAGWIEVIHDHYDVLVYLVEKKPGELALGHSAPEVKKLY